MAQNLLEPLPSLSSSQFINYLKERSKKKDAMRSGMVQRQKMA